MLLSASRQYSEYLGYSFFIIETSQPVSNIYSSQVFKIILNQFLLDMCCSLLRNPTPILFILRPIIDPTWSLFCNTVTYNFLTMDPPILNILLPEFSYLNNLGNVRPHSNNYRKCKPVMVSQVMKM